MIKTFCFEKYLDCLIKIIPLNLAALVLLTIYRLFFFLYFARFQESALSFSDIFGAFWLGFRYDLSILAFINMLPMLIWTFLLIFRSFSLFKFSAVLIKFYYFLAFMTLAVIISVDFGFYSVFNEHINILIFSILGDNLSLTSASVSKEKAFVIAVIILIVLAITLYKLIAWTIRQTLNKHCLINTMFWNGFAKTIIVLASWAVLAFLAQGSFSLSKPFYSEHLREDSNGFSNKLSVGAAHSFARTVAFYIETSRENQEEDQEEIPEEI